MLDLTAFVAKTRENIWILYNTQLRAKIISQVAENEFQSWQVSTETLRYTVTLSIMLLPSQDVYSLVQRKE